MKYIKYVITVLVLFGASNVYSAGWTGYGKITEINQQPSGVADVLIVADLPNNGTNCAVKNKFLLDVTDSRDERTFTILLSAFMAGKEVRLFVADGCPVWDMPKITGVYVR